MSEPTDGCLKDLQNVAEVLQNLGYTTEVIGGENFGDSSFICVESDAGSVEISCAEDKILLECWSPDGDEEPAQTMTTETWLQAIESSKVWLRAS